MLNTENLLSRITVIPGVMVGKPTIRGMRITVEQILKAIAGGVSEKELLEEYPELEKEDFHAVYSYFVCIKKINLELEKLDKKRIFYPKKQNFTCNTIKKC